MYLVVVVIAGVIRPVICGAAVRENAEVPAAASQGDPQQPDSYVFHSYRVDRPVSGFPPKPDFTTPEAAFATIMRDYVSTGAGGKEWSRISVSWTGDHPRVRVSPQKAWAARTARIVEVLVYRKRLAQVTAEYRERGSCGYDQRYLMLHKGRWLNSGQGELVPTPEATRKDFVSRCEKLYAYNLQLLGETAPSRFSRPAVKDPEAHLRPYVDFLRKQGRSPHAFVMEALRTHDLVAIGEVHNRPAYWAFNIQLVRDPAFAHSVGTIYLELPANHQEAIDRFLAGDARCPEPVIAMLRDMTLSGWPCQATLDFFLAVWDTNRALSPAQRLRIRMVDMLRPWEQIRSAAHLKRYRVDRDRFMAENILADRRRPHADGRHGLFIAGMGHVATTLHGVDGHTPVQTAGWHLRQALGDNMLAAFQHTPAITNSGVVEGRLALGLLDSAFEELDNQPVAFSLREGPFGQLPFDAMPDQSFYGIFRDGFDAYLFLADLDGEILSPLIEGFYSDEYVSELRRRLRLSGQASAAERTTPEALLAIKRLYWGNPRWAGQLGPKTAWKWGDEWQVRVERQRVAEVKREELTALLDNVYRGIRHIHDREYDISGWGREFGFSYQTATNWPGMIRWWRDVTRRCPLESVEYGPVERTEQGLPQIAAVARLKDGTEFTSRFEFKYLPLMDTWQARRGLDMHLDGQWKDLAGHLPDPPVP